MIKSLTLTNCHWGFRFFNFVFL